MKRQQAFTLVELLVVIAVIGILASLLMPALQRASTLAKQTACTNQLRQIGMSVPQYANEYGEYVPGRVQFLGDNTGWVLCLAPYLGGDTILWVCPAAADRREPQFANYMTGTRRMVTNAGVSAYLHQVQTIGINGWAFPYTTVKLTKVRNAAKLMYAADATGWSTSLYAPQNPNGWRLLGAHVYPDDGASMYPHHGRNINQLCLDGHAISRDVDKARANCIYASCPDMNIRDQWVVR